MSKNLNVQFENSLQQRKQLINLWILQEQNLSYFNTQYYLVFAKFHLKHAYYLGDSELGQNYCILLRKIETFVKDTTIPTQTKVTFILEKLEEIEKSILNLDLHNRNKIV